MTTLTFPTNTIMGLVTEGGSVGLQALDACLPNWAGDFVIFWRLGSGADAGLAKFNIDPDGSKVAEATIGALGVSGIADSSGGANALSADARNVFFLSDLTGPYNIARTSDLAFLSTRTVATAPYMALPLADGASTDGFSFMGQGTTHIIRFMSEVGDILGAMTNIDTITGGGALGVCLGRKVPVNGTNYAVDYRITSNVAVPVYSFTTAGATLLGSFSPSDIDAGWTNITNLAGAAFDQTDGNLICAAETTDAVTNKDYIFKVSATTGAVLWTRPVGTSVPASWAMMNSRVQNGKYHFIGAGGLIHHIDTSDGSETTETVDGLSTGGGIFQYSDDVTNSIIFRSSFDQGAHPTNPCNFVGLYMNTEGNHTLTSQWGRIWFATAGPPPAGSGRRWFLGELGPVRT